MEDFQELANEACPKCEGIGFTPEYFRVAGSTDECLNWRCKTCGRLGRQTTTADASPLRSRAERRGIIKGNAVYCYCDPHPASFRPGSSSKATEGTIKCTRCNTVIWSPEWPKRYLPPEYYDWPALRKEA